MPEDVVAFALVGKTLSSTVRSMSTSISLIFLTGLPSFALRRFELLSINGLSVSLRSATFSLTLLRDLAGFLFGERTSPPWGWTCAASASTSTLL